MIEESMPGPTPYIARLRRGDDKAWKAFMSDQGRVILLVARRMGLGPEERDEVFQNTCLSVLRFLDGLKKPEKLNSWVYTIAHRHALDAKKGRGRSSGWGESPGNHPLDEFPDAGPDDLEVLERVERVDQLHRAMEALPEGCRGLLTALYLDPSRPSYEEISRRSGMPVGSIGPTRARCLNKLRAALSKVSKRPSRGSTQVKTDTRSVPKMGA